MACRLCTKRFRRVFVREYFQFVTHLRVGAAIWCRDCVVDPPWPVKCIARVFTDLDNVLISRHIATARTGRAFLTHTTLNASINTCLLGFDVAVSQSIDTPVILLVLCLDTGYIVVRKVGDYFTFPC